MAQETKTGSDAILTRLRRIEGQIRGIHKMLEEDRVCEDVVTQLMAARSSLDKAGLLIIDRHIEQCLTVGLSNDDALHNLKHSLRLWFRFGGAAQSQQD